MNAVTLNEFKRNLDSVLKKVEDDQDAVIIVGENGEKFVVMPLAEFNAWQETAYLLSNPANAANLRESIEQGKNGRVVEHELVEQ